MMFSATFPKEARQLAKEYLANDHIRIRVGRAGSSHMNIQQKVNWTPVIGVHANNHHFGLLTGYVGYFRRRC